MVTMIEITDDVLKQQLQDPRANVPLSEMSQEQLHAYYLNLERRIVGANVAMFECGGHAPWVIGLPDDDIELAFEALHGRWMSVVRALDFADAATLASTSRERREAIRVEARAKIKPKAQADSGAESAQVSSSESQYGQARATARDVVRAQRLPTAEA